MHKTVLLQEAVNSLKLEPGAVVVDATLGAGGHTLALAKAVGEQGKVIAIDLDGSAISNFKKELEDQPELTKRIFLKQGNFKNIVSILDQLGIERVDAVLADLGWRIEQVEDEKYGMSIFRAGALDMRLAQNEGVSALKVVNDFSQRELAQIFWELGEEKQARKIAEAIVTRRVEQPIRTTVELAALVEEVAGSSLRKGKKVHPATKVFQALRIYVNQELENLSIFLNDSLKILKQGGRLAVISFHSLEDRMVKNFFRENARGCVCPKELPVCACKRKQKLKINNKKPIIASDAEVAQNKRARSARLRVATKVENKNGQTKKEHEKQGAKSK